MLAVAWPVPGGATWNSPNEPVTMKIVLKKRIARFMNVCRRHTWPLPSARQSVWSRWMPKILCSRFRGKLPALSNKGCSPGKANSNQRTGKVDRKGRQGRKERKEILEVGFGFLCVRRVLCGISCWLECGLLKA